MAAPTSYKTNADAPANSNSGVVRVQMVNSSGTILDGGGGGASTVANGADVTQGAIADAAVTAGATGSISAKLRSISRDLVANIVLAAGSNTIGGVNIIKQPSVTSTTVTQVASSATNVTLQASNASRKSLLIFNDSTAALFVKFGATASATSFTVKIAAAGYWEMPSTAIYTGIVDGIWASANGNAYVTEL